MNNVLYDLILRSTDSTLSENEAKKLQELLNTSPDAQQIRNELLQLKQLTESKNSSSFSPFFTERVIARLQEPKESLADRFFSVFRPIAFSALVLTVLFSSYNILHVNSFTLFAPLGIHSQTLEQKLTLEVPFE
jgi:hypothetical protein